MLDHATVLFMAHALIAKVAVTVVASLGSVQPAMPAANVPVVREACPVGGGSCYYDRTIYVDPNTGGLRFRVWHEMGHAVDEQRLVDPERVVLELDMGMSGPWNVGTGDHGRTSPNEWFADGYATCATQRRSHRVDGMAVSESNVSYGFNLVGKRLKMFCAHARAFAAS